MKLNRRQFISSITTAGCAAALPLGITAERMGSKKLDRTLRQAIHHYGDLVHLSQQGNHIKARVRIQDINSFGAACNKLSKLSKVYAEGNDLRFQSGQFKVSIHNIS